MSFYRDVRFCLIIDRDVENITVEIMQKIRAAHWNIEMRQWLLDISL